MCGRVSITYDEYKLQERFHAKFVGSFKPCFNAAPSQNLPVILNTDPEHIRLVRWGLRPSWFKGKDGLINIRAETLEEKKTFKKNLDGMRCLVLADGFYEWKHVGSKKIPYRFTLKNKEPFAFAGLWDSHGEEEFAIITTTPNALAKEVHNRMPVILEKKNEERWLKKGELSLLDSYDPKEMAMYEVSTLVNNPRNDVEEVTKGIEKK